MRRLILAGLVGLGFAVVVPGAHAQVGFSPGFSDPFFLYYGFYLPRQAALAAQPTVTTQLNDVTAARQNLQMQDRQSALYGPMQSPFDPSNPEGPYGSFQGPGRQKIPRPPAHFAAPKNVNNRSIPHFNELASKYPTARIGSSPNRNMANTRRASGGMGMMGMGMPGAPPGVGAPVGSYGR
jgi:hypothetical protein